MNIKKIYRAIMTYDEFERTPRTLIKVVPQKARPRIHKKTMRLTDREWDLLLEKLEIAGKKVEPIDDNVAIMGVYEGIWSW